jgi:exonuclease SbcC
MITSVTIINFQSHTHSELHFSEGTNILIGNSDTGKSAVFRAVVWVVTNRPLGDAFRSEWGGDTRVRIETDDGNVVERIKGPSKNEYIVNGEILKAFGTDVPEQVNEALRIDQYNIQAQMDMPFLLASSPGEAARMLNQAASIEDIDLVLSEVKKSHDRIRRELDSDQSQLASHQTAMEQYQNIPEIESKIVVVEEKTSEYNRKGIALTRLAEVISILEWATFQLTKKQYVEEAESKYTVAYELNQSLQQKTQSKIRLDKLVSRITQIHRELKSTDHIDEALEKAKQGMKLQEGAQRIQSTTKSLGNLISQLTRTQSSLSQINVSLETAEQEYEKLMPDNCPLCGSEVR